MIFTNELIFQVMAWFIVVLGTGFVSLLIYFATKVINKLDRLEELVRTEFHELDLRVARLEAWRDGFLERDHPHKGMHQS